MLTLVWVAEFACPPSVFCDCASASLQTTCVLVLVPDAIHHIYPFIPFYRYSQVWFRHKQELLDNGVRVLPFFLCPSRSAYLPELRQPPKGVKGE